ncbi:hypothetical protein LP420_35595 [Massilia sp. B-10]|nr:hypothetical protein LP420_35595 [Massilia sp. B-10]
MAAMAKNKEEAAQKALFATFYTDYAASRPLFLKAEAGLAQIQKLNETIAAEQTRASEQASASARRTMLVSAILAAVLAFACAYYIALSITGPINDAVRVAQTVASGDLTSTMMPAPPTRPASC